MSIKRRVRVLPYKQGSRGAKALAEALGGRVLKLQGSGFVARSDDLVINWGNSSEASRSTINNDGVKLEQATNKLLFFNKLRDTGLTPKYWTNANDIPDDAFPVVCRQTLQGHSGAGIVVANVRDDLVAAPLYTQYVKKKHEYRIHVGRRWVDFGVGTAVAIGVEGEMVYKVIGVQQKKRRLEHPDPNWQVRNYANGFVYAREGVNPPDSVLKAAKDTLAALDIDFGAVDVIWNEHENRPYVLEINTAPGLEGSTVTDYKEFFESAT
ncbi:MAG: putative alpha-L-glutamate ligase [Prokaryotic dsDNA virus sp.]|nr:MAG: putative alpha-L-glutamate ligase [Prokaryotic dsDNA virus sp.]|tara:strand:- start:1108 stop:1908 length:801 start_codon:yes stop_codon:yes gene_type:complete